MNNDKTSILVTGINWMGAGIGSIETAMEHLFQDASDELLLTVYSISTRTDLLFDLLDAALSRGVQTKMVINSFEKQPRRVVKRLRDFVSKYPHFLLHGFSGGDQSDLCISHELVGKKSSNPETVSVFIRRQTRYR